MEEIGANLDVWRRGAMTVGEKARRAEMYSAKTRHLEWSVGLSFGYVLHLRNNLFVFFSLCLFLH